MTNMSQNMGHIPQKVGHMPQIIGLKPPKVVAHALQS